ncbi:hypothetical protein [Virgibacillus natechei]|uniref:hypothetical protein n=1 Tax=Virgibacillus natechei TaxID=1216297 RepID=UPI001AE1ACBB|nr:hypothetical protein [Virgibacillus natechei]UZD12767.1 hypothetical protein OLD84_18055 [Virgibacillus natechei]
MFFSLFTQNTVATFIQTALATAGGYFLTTMSSVSEVSHFLPFTYLNAGKITNGELATVLNNSSIQPLLGIGVLVASSFLLLSAGVIRFRNSGKQPPKTNTIE